MYKVFSLLLGIIIPALASCSRSDDRSATPLPTAWPRIDISAADSMTVVEGLPVEVRVNSRAEWHSDSADGLPALTVTYPGANTYIYYTFIPVRDEEERAGILERRSERIALNLNGAPAQTIHAGAPDDDSQAVIVVASTGTQTPVQLLAQTPGWVISATSFIDDPRAAVAYDSIRPIVDVLRSDMERTVVF